MNLFFDSVFLYNSNNLSSAYSLQLILNNENIFLSQCEKLRKKRSSLVGAFVSTHGKSIDDVDRSIVEAR